MAKELDIPTDREQWLTAAKEFDVYNESIHRMRDLTSASKMSNKQFLALRAVWVPYDHDKFDAQYWGIHISKIDEARKRLENISSWNSYLDKIKVNELNPVPTIPESLGSFSHVSYYQQLVQQTLGTEQGEPAPGPTVKTRSSTKAETAARTGAQPITPKSLDVNQMFAELDISSGSEEQSSAEKTPNSPLFDESLRPLMYPRVDDEQIVNACLINFLNALGFHFQDMKGQWSLRRKAFGFGFDKALKKPLFQAQTDGHLWMQEGGAAVSKVIVEVKPGLRGDNIEAIMRQETGEMACWIYAEPNAQDGSKIYRRVMTSQDRHEIYLIIAEYDDAYLQYIKNDNQPDDPFVDAPKVPDDDIPLMTMHQFGPWVVSRKGHMEQLGIIILALMLQDGKLDFQVDDPSGSGPEGKGSP